MFKNLAEKARTFRRFDQSKPITVEDMESMIDIARITPCGGNFQPLRYRIVNSGECNKVFPLVAWAGALKDWCGPAEGERPTGYIVILSDAARGEPLVDIGIAAYAIQLAATDMGLGACMMGAIQRPEIHAALALPPEWKVRLIVALGEPAETVRLEELNGEDTNYYRTPDNVHHVPKRKLMDIIITKTHDRPTS